MILIKRFFDFNYKITVKIMEIIQKYDKINIRKYEEIGMRK